ncbi:162_t:CDS:1, partial [Paraglomus occultum]
NKVFVFFFQHTEETRVTDHDHWYYHPKRKREQPNASDMENGTRYAIRDLNNTVNGSTYRIPQFILTVTISILPKLNLITGCDKLL